MRFTTSILLAIGLSGAACVYNKPVHYYAIQLPPPSPSPGKPDGLVLVVGAFTAPEALQDARIRYRAGSNESGAYEYHRWTERPDSMVHDALVRALRATGQYQRVLEASSTAAGDYLVRGKLYEFGEVDGASIQTRILLHVEMVDKRTNLTVWDRAVDREEPVSAKTVLDVVQSLDRNLQHAVTETAAEIDKFLSKRP